MYEWFDHNKTFHSKGIWVMNKNELSPMTIIGYIYFSIFNNKEVVILGCVLIKEILNYNFICILNAKIFKIRLKKNVIINFQNHSKSQLMI